MRVAVIGGGPSGLISAKHCSTSLKDLECLHIYEKLSCLGGAWCKDEEHSILYDNLRTNLPKEVMEFDGLKYENDKQQSSFIAPTVVNEYLLKFIEIFQLEKYVKFQTEVIKVNRINGEWELTLSHLPSNQRTNLTYDAVFVCNGHYTVPMVPEFDGLDTFKRNKEENVVIHSIKYRRPDKYTKLRVLVIGGGPSAQDIAIDIASEATEVLLSHHYKELCFVKFPANVLHKPDVAYFNEDSVTFVDESKCQIDKVVLATGFKYQLDFLDVSCGISIEDHGYVTPLYKQLISIQHPTMAFIGLPFRTLIFPLLETQVKCVVQILNGKVTLPSADEMHRERLSIEEINKSNGIPKKKYHNLAGSVKQYLTELFELGKIEPLEKVIFGIYEKTMALRRADLVTYRNHNFVILDSENYLVQH